MDADKMPEVCVLCLIEITLPPRSYPICPSCLETLRALPDPQRVERVSIVLRAVEARLQRESNEKTAEMIRQAAYWTREAAQHFGDIVALAKQNWRDADDGYR